MALPAGTRLGPFEIVSPIGAGGMGEVYRARDTRLERFVAIKVLPAQLAGDPEFRARFEREARTISGLNHPHICTLHDVGREGDIEYLVMELLEGETLASRLSRGPIASDDALAYAVQIADALDKAHRSGVVHRDLKPANIFLVKSGSGSGAGICKLLDFGLAKIGASPDSGIVETKLATSPPDQALTSRGSLLGTFQYMSPEQIEGTNADARSDIWAFGCVLYEMLTGRRAFEGKSQASLIASILERQPAPIGELQPMTPPALGRIVRTCLEKDPDNRFHTAHDLCLHLQWIEEGGSAAGLPAPVIAGRKRRQKIAYAAMGLAAVIVVSAGVWSLKPAPVAEDVVSRFLWPLPEDQRFSRGGRRVIAVSPDGRQFAYVANEQIYLRRMNELESTPVRGTNVDPVDIEFSPDGEWIAFFAPLTMRAQLGNCTLRKIAVSGGVSVPIASGINFPSGLRWQGDTLVFSSNGRSIRTVPESGGQPTEILALDPQSAELISHPMLLEGGTELLYTVRPTGGQWDDGSIVVRKITGGEPRVIVHGGTDGRVTSGGQLLYVSGGTLFAQKIDPRTLASIGGPVPVLEGVRGTSVTGTGQYAVAANGTLVHVRGGLEGESTFVWVDRAGREEAIGTPPRSYTSGRLSPDGTKILTDIRGEDADVWVWDLIRKTLSKVTSGPERDEYARWSADGKFVYYRSNPNGRPDLFKRAVDGTGTVERITDSDQTEALMMLLPGQAGRFLVRANLPNTPAFMAIASVGQKGDVKPLVASNVAQLLGEISPDGRWIAYQSAEGSTQDQIYVRPFPDVDRGRWQVSVDDGSVPAWSRTGDELFFRSGRPSRMHVAKVLPSPPGGDFRSGPPQPLFGVTSYGIGAFERGYDVSLDGKRFLMTKREGAEVAQEVVIVLNWFTELESKLPSRR